MTTPVTSITLVPGGSAIHILVQNAADGNTLSPGDISWVFADVNGNLVPPGVVANASPDATGFNFSCPATVSEGTKGSARATYNPTGAVGSLALMDGMTVTSLQFVIG